MRTQFFSTSAGFWEKVAITVTLVWDPWPEGAGAFFVAWFGGLSAPKNENSPKQAVFSAGL
jgi:hypothetical protein